MKAISVVTVGAAALLAAACGPAREPANEETPAVSYGDAEVWLCGDIEVSIAFANGAAVLTAGGETFHLHSAVAASGARYEEADDPDTSFWEKGDSALLSIRGESFPECTTASAAPDAANKETASDSRLPYPFTARGNEPGWNVEIGDTEIALVSQYGETRLTAMTPSPEIAADYTRYDIPEENLTITVFHRNCADDATGMPHPYVVTVDWGDANLRGCGGEPLSMLLGDEWTVTDIGGEGLIEGSRVTLLFGEDERVSGSASCNRFNTAYRLTGEGLSFGLAAVTNMACAPEAAMEQEQRFLEILGQVYRFAIDDDGALVLHANDGLTITARR